jgi:hypothetical protein
MNRRITSSIGPKFAARERFPPSLQELYAFRPTARYTDVSS